MTCPNCGREFTLEEGFAYCPYCGAKADEKKRITGWLRAALLGLLCILLAGGVLFGVGALANRYLETDRAASREVSSVALSVTEHRGGFYPGDTAKLVPEFLPEVKRAPRLSWSSSDESVAIVDETGRVSILKEGEAEITVLLENGVSAGLTVKANKKPERFTLGEEQITLKKGATHLLDAAAYPAGSAFESIEWKSSDSGILSVDENGRLKALSRGRATVTATLDCGLEAKVDVLVFEFGFDILADLITREGEVDYASKCAYLILDHEQETNEDNILVHKYTELIYFPKDDAISLCCDIYDDEVSMYYEMSVDFYRDERYNAYINFRCSLAPGSGGSHMTLLSADARIDAEGQGGFYLPNYVPGCSAVFHWYEGDATYRETAQQISDGMLEYAMNKLKEKWSELDIDITYAEALNLDQL